MRELFLMTPNADLIHFLYGKCKDSRLKLAALLPTKNLFTRRELGSFDDKRVRYTHNVLASNFYDRHKTDSIILIDIRINNQNDADWNRFLKKEYQKVIEQTVEGSDQQVILALNFDDFADIHKFLNIKKIIELMKDESKIEFLIYKNNQDFIKVLGKYL